MKVFNDSKKLFIKELLTKTDILFLQEFWLLESTLHKLQTLPSDFLCAAISGVEPGEILKGRPYGGAAILWNKSLNADVKPLKTNSKRICAVKLNTAEISIIIICVYLPCDNYSNTNASDELLFELSQIEALLNDSVYQHILLGGDFNSDLSRNNVQTKSIVDFLNKWSLRTGWQSHTATPGPTYLFSDNGPSSQIDHFAFSRSLFESLRSMVVNDRPDTPSRHYAIAAELDQSIATLPIQMRQFIPKIAWYKAKEEEKQQYSTDLRVMLEDVLLRDSVIECDNLTCTSENHKSAIDNFCSNIIQACFEADQNIPRTKPPKKSAVAGWTDDVEPVRQISIFWHNVWVDCGRPGQGAVADVRRLTRRNYHNAVKTCLKNQKAMQRQRLGELASKKGSRPIFDELKKLAGTNRCCVNKIDGLQNDTDICQKFKSKYRDVYNFLGEDNTLDIEQAIEARVNIL